MTFSPPFLIGGGGDKEYISPALPRGETRENKEE